MFARQLGAVAVVCVLAGCVAPSSTTTRSDYRTRAATRTENGTRVSAAALSPDESIVAYGVALASIARRGWDFVYFSFTVLTSTGFGDITPLNRLARGICVVAQIVGALFVAILIARLAGVYPPENERGKSS